VFRRPHRVGLVLGVWFLAAAWGNNSAGGYTSTDADALAVFFLQQAASLRIRDRPHLRSKRCRAPLPEGVRAVVCHGGALLRMDCHSAQPRVHGPGI
jgi:hypothetical protein